MKKKIAVIGLKGLPAFGGAAAVGESLLEILKDKYDFTVYSVDSHTDHRTGEFNGFKQIVLKRFLKGNKSTFVYYFKSAIRVIFGNYDIVHIHHASATFIIPLIRLRHKVILTTHGVHNVLSDPKWANSNWYFRLQNKLVPYANIVTCVSKREIGWIKEYMKVSPVHIPNGINLGKKLEANLKNTKLFFAAGRVTEVKGCHVLLDALKILDYKGEVEIAGDLSHDLNYTELLKEKAKGLDIKFIGLIKDKEKLLKKVSSSRLFILPSLREAMSMMLMEAASVKAKLICSDILENKDVFTENEVLFFENKSSHDLANKILWAFDHEEEMERKTELAYMKLIKEHNWSEIAQSYAKLYEKLL
jgi:glycosyltransferase involved in cell wall biosynthesis